MVNLIFDEMKKNVATDVAVSWKWSNESNGLVQWTFTNSGTTEKSVVLFRNGYFFGGAFWAVYLDNIGFDTTIITAVSPLIDKGVQNNSPPLMVGKFTNGYGMCFVFTLSPAQSWSMLEGGFSATMTPSGAMLYEVAFSDNAEAMCLGYSPQQVAQWDEQAGDNFSGYSPNPKTYMALVGAVDAPYVEEFVSTITVGECSTGSSPPVVCHTFLDNAQHYINTGNFWEAVGSIISYLECLENKVFEKKS